MSALALSRRFERTERKGGFAGGAESTGGNVDLAVSEPITDDLVSPRASGDGPGTEQGEWSADPRPRTPITLSPNSANASLRPWSRSW